MLLAAAALFVVAGCGEGEGVAEDATVTVYVAAPLCAGAKGELARSGGRAGSVRVSAVCLAGVREGERIDLATIGANARRATQDSTTVAYIGDPTPAETRFSRPILEEADIPQLPNQPGAKAMSKLLKAIQQAGSTGNLRGSIHDTLS